MFKYGTKIITVLIFLFTASLFAQRGIITGKVTDRQGNPLIGANVILKGTVLGSATDSDGEFQLTRIKPGEYQIEASMVGYAKYISELIKIDGNEIFLDIELNKTSLQFDQIIVTAGKYKQDISELPVSAGLINSDEISKKNFTKLDDALRYVPGVSITMDQVSIRGSSGYSRGAGTRVLVAIDGIPMYTGDSGEIVWEVVPITDLERVEIIKGAASSLYGSTAIGGVINVITKEIPSNPLTYIKTYFGAYDKPAHDEWDWSGEYRTFNGITLAHSNRIGRLGFSASLTRTEDLSYRKDDWQKRYSGYLKTKYNFSESTSLTFLATGFTRDKGIFNFWKDSRNALVRRAKL